jgi:hypothetical protein
MEREGGGVTSCLFFFYHDYTSVNNLYFIRNYKMVKWRRTKKAGHIGGGEELRN